MDKRMTVYHGSHIIVEQPVFGVGNPHNDYGIGFYCTENAELAKEWACSNNEDGFANEYSFDITELSVLSLTGGDYNILNWLYILLENREFNVSSDIALQAKEYIFENFAIEYKNYDIIKGYRADDSYFSFAKAFLNNTISLSQLEKAMVLGKLGEQVVAVSQKAFSQISFNKAIPAPAKIYYPKKAARDNKARAEFEKVREKGNVLTEKYILDIMREGWENDDTRLQRVVLG